MELRSSLDKCGHEDLFVDPKWKSIVDVSISWFDCSNDVFQLSQIWELQKQQNGTVLPEATLKTMQPLTRLYYGSWEKKYLLISVRFVLLSQTVTLTLISFMHHRWKPLNSII